MEIWKDIKGYEEHYQISNRGRCKSLKYKKEAVLKERISRGYCYYHLCKNNKCTQFQAHRLVAQAFLGLDINFTDSKKSLCVCHKDDNPLNNNVDNLFLGTNKDNVNDMAKKGRHKGTTGKLGKLSKLSKMVGQFSLQGDLIKIWNSLSDVERELNMSNSLISRVCTGKQKTAYGYKWSYNF